MSTAQKLLVAEIDRLEADLLLALAEAVGLRAEAQALVADVARIRAERDRALLKLGERTNRMRGPVNDAYLIGLGRLAAGLATQQQEDNGS